MLERFKRPTHANAYLLLTLTMLFWAGNYTIGRWATGHVPPVTLAFLRWTGAALLVLPLAWRHVTRSWKTIKSNLPILLALGVTGAGLFNTLQYNSADRHTPPTLASSMLVAGDDRRPEFS